jgi:uncharacterized protein YjbI with pentapeptide repeats
MTTALSEILTTTKMACALAEDTGKLDMNGVCKLAMEVGAKVNTIVGLSATEREALILLFLKKGLSAAASFQNLSVAQKDTILQGALKAAEMLPGLFNCCLPSWAPKLSLSPTDADILKEALQSRTARTDLSGAALSGVVQLDLSGVSIEYAAAQFVTRGGVSLRAVDLSGSVLVTDVSGNALSA